MDVHQNSLLEATIRDLLIGVIDLIGGKAVHAIAGQRSRYCPVNSRSVTDGCFIQLAKHYHRLGLRHLYIADLDSIRYGQPQFESVIRLLRDSPSWTSVLIDFGWRGDEPLRAQQSIAHLTHEFPSLGLIAATESMNGIHAVRELVSLVPPTQVLLGLDYIDGQLQGAGEESQWIQTAFELQIQGIVALDLRSVGGKQGPNTMTICRRIRDLIGNQKLISGGGIRSGTDVLNLMDSGCDQCLVATALL